MNRCNRIEYLPGKVVYCCMGRYLFFLWFLLLLPGCAGPAATVESTAKPPDGKSLLEAVRKGDAAALRVLVSAGAPVTTKVGEYKETLLHLAAQNGHLEITRLLISAGAELNAKDRDGFTPLHEAVYWMHPDMVKLLLEGGADIRVGDGDGLTALHWAAFWGRVEEAKLLLERGAGVDMRNIKNGETPLHSALAGNDIEVADLLLSKGANMLAWDVHARVPMWKLPEENRYSWLDYEEFRRLFEKHAAGRREGIVALMDAVRAGDLLKTRQLIVKGADVNGVANFVISPLHIAAEKGHVDIVRALLDGGADVSGARSDTSSEEPLPLHRAACEGHRAVVELLLARGAQVDSTLPLPVFFPDEEGNPTALHFAVREGHRDIVELLLSKGADANTRDGDGHTALELALKCDRKEIAAVLRKRGASAPKPDESDDGLCEAVRDRDIARIKKLLAAGADVKGELWDDSPLEVAVELGYRDVAEVLIASGADVNKLQDSVPGYGSATLLSSAVQEGSLEKVRLLLAIGANPNKADSDGWTPLHQALYCEHDEIVKLLIAKSADVNAQVERYTDTPLHRAVSKDSAEYLLKRGASINAKDSRGRTPLDAALDNGNWETAEFLRDHGAKSKNPAMAALFFAAKDGNAEKLVKLLEKGASADCRNEKGLTPLHVAVSNRRAASVQVLIARGADVNAQTDYGETGPLDLALEGKYEQIVQLLLKHGAKSGKATRALAEPIEEGNLARVKALFEQHADPGGEVRLGDGALLMAAKYGQKEIAQFLLTQGAPIGGTGLWGDTALHEAAENGHESIVRLLVEKGADVNTKGGHGRTPLHVAVSCKKPQVVKALVACGAGVDVRDEDGTAPLHVAAAQGNAEIARMLLAAGANPGAADSSGLTPLHSAAANNRKEMIGVLAAGGVALEAKDADGRTALHLAARGNYTDAAQALIERGARLDAKEARGAGPLHLAAQTGAAGTATLLLEKRAHVNSLDNSGLTPLDWAEDCHQHEVARLLRARGGKLSDPRRHLLFETAKKGDLARARQLVAQGAAVNSRDLRGRNPLHYAAMKCDKKLNHLLYMGAVFEPDPFYEKRDLFRCEKRYGHGQTAQFLVAAGADVNARDAFGWTPLHCAASENNSEVARILLENGADPNAAAAKCRFPLLYTEGKTPLHYAASRGHKEVVELLVRAGANINARDSSGATPLHLAVLYADTTGIPHGVSCIDGAWVSWTGEKSHMDVIARLIGSGADVNAKTDSGHAALHFAAMTSGFDETTMALVKILISSGAQVNAQSRYGQTPVDITRNYCNDKLEGLLRKHGAKLANEK